MTKNQLENQISELGELVQKLNEVSNLAEAQRDQLIEEGHAEYEAAYNLILRSIGQAAVTADALASVSHHQSSDRTPGVPAEVVSADELLDSASKRVARAEKERRQRQAASIFTPDK